MANDKEKYWFDRRWPNERFLEELESHGLTLSDAAEMSDDDLLSLPNVGRASVEGIRTLQIEAGLKTQAVEETERYRLAIERGYPSNLALILAKANLTLKQTAQMSEADLSDVPGLGRCGIARLRDEQIKRRMKSYHISMYKVSRLCIRLGIRASVVKALLQAELSLEDAAQMSDAELLGLSGVSQKTLRDIRRLQFESGLDFVF